MRRRALISTLLPIVTCQAWGQAPFSVQIPSLQVGDRWRFVTFDGLSKLETGWRTEEVVSVGADAMVLSFRSGSGSQGEVTYDREWNQLLDVKGKVQKAAKFAFPLESGRSWDSRWEWVNARGRDGRMEMNYRVDGPERVTVMAGEFDAVLIEGSGRWFNNSTGSSGVALERRWYAPKAKRSIRRTWITRYAGGNADQNLITELSELHLKP